MAKNKGNTEKVASPMDLAEALEQASANAPQAVFVLRLYVTGMTPRSQKAIGDIRKLCQEHLPGRHELEIVDIYQHPDAAKEAQIIATPTLIKKLPLPLKKVVGDLASPGRVLVALGLKKP